MSMKMMSSAVQEEDYPKQDRFSKWVDCEFRMMVGRDVAEAEADQLIVSTVSVSASVIARLRKNAVQEAARRGLSVQSIASGHSKPIEGTEFPHSMIFSS